MEPANYSSNVPKNEEPQGDCDADDDPSNWSVFDAILAAACPLQHRSVFVARPNACTFPHPSRATDRDCTERDLMRSVVADDPVAPERSHCVNVEAEASPPLRDSAVSSRRWIEGDPAVSGKVSLDPRVSIFRAHDVVAGQVVELI